MFDYFRALKMSGGTSKEKMKQHEGRLSRQDGLDRGGGRKTAGGRSEGGRREGSDRDED